MKKYVTAALTALTIVCGSAGADAQTWKGVYLGGTIGGAFRPDDADERVGFDTNLDGVFTDTVRTAAGIDAFTPGFCGGRAGGPTPSTGCADDEDGLDFGGRIGYDWQSGAIVFGVVGELSNSTSNAVNTFVAGSRGAKDRCDLWHPWHPGSIC